MDNLVLQILEVDRVAISLGKINIYWYSILILTGILIAYCIARKECKNIGIKINDLDDFAFGLIPIAILGARIYYCIFTFNEFKNNILGIFKIWEGGLAIHGGIIAGVIWLIYFTKKRRINVLKFMDIVAPGLILAQAIGRWGNFFNGEAHGGIVTRTFLENLHLPKFIIEGMNIKGVYYQPTFLYESIWCILGFILIYTIYKKIKINGLTLSIYLSWYSLGRFFIENLRTDSLMIGPLRIAQVISIILFTIGIIGIIISIKRKEVR